MAGSYWVYQNYSVDSLGNGRLFGSTEATVLIGNSTLNDYNYKNLGMFQLNTNQKNTPTNNICWGVFLKLN